MATEIAPGFVDLQYLFSKRLTEVGWQIINDAVSQSAAIFSQQQDELMRLFASPIDPTRPRIKFRLPVSVEMQPLQGEDDSPVPARGWDEYEVAFPLFDVGLAWGTNRKSRAKMTVEDANEYTVHALQADSRWHRRQILTALFQNTAYTFNDPEFGTLTVKGLANGDSDKYVMTNGDKATDNHYLAQLNAISATDYPFDDIHDELMEHPSNRGEVVVLVPTNLKASIRSLPDFLPFVESARIQPGTSGDVLTSFPDLVLGDRRLGYVEDGECYIAEWKALPDGYMIAYVTDPGQATLGYRDEPEAELQGVRTELASYDGNHVVERLLRTRGFGVRNRIGMVVYRVGSASYTVPTGYAAPNP